MKRAGFTLVEVLVALALAALLAITVQSLVVHAYRVSRSVEQRQAARDQGQMTLDLIEADLRSLPVGSGVELKEGALTFATLNAQRGDLLAARQMVQVRYSRQVDGQVQRQEALPGQRIQDAAGVGLEHGIKRLALAVYDGQTWQKDWPLPAGRAAWALRVELALDEDCRVSRVVPLGPFRWSTEP